MSNRPPRPISSPLRAATDGSGRTPSHAESAGFMKSRVVKRSIVVGHHKTSVSLEDVFWNELRRIAAEQGVALSQLVGRIDAERQHGNLSSALRVFVFEQSCQRADGASPKPSVRADLSSTYPPFHRWLRFC